VGQTVAAEKTATYLVRIENDNPTRELFKVAARADCARFKVQYFDAPVGGTDITAQIATTTWATPLLDHGAWCDLRVEVTPQAGLAARTRMHIRIVAVRPPTAPLKDVALLTTTVALQRRPDGLIRVTDEASFAGDDIYNADGAGQTKELTVAAGGAAVFLLRVQNDGSAPDQFQVAGPADSPGWTIRYYDAPTGGNDVTWGANRNGWLTRPTAVGATRDLRVEVTPDSSVPPGTALELLIRMRSFSEKTTYDAVKAVVTRE